MSVDVTRVILKLWLLFDYGDQPGMVVLPDGRAHAVP
jgi:hypothetical protein